MYSWWSVTSQQNNIKQSRVIPVTDPAKYMTWKFVKQFRPTGKVNILKCALPVHRLNNFERPMTAACSQDFFNRAELQKMPTAVGHTLKLKTNNCYMMANVGSV
jgi:hypothetical protein